MIQDKETGMNRNDTDRSSRAAKAAVLRAVVAGYIGYLGYKIFCAEDTTMSLVTAHILGIVFMAAAAGFAVYIVIRWRADMKAVPDNAAEETAEADTGADENE